MEVHIVHNDTSSGKLAVIALFFDKHAARTDVANSSQADEVIMTPSGDHISDAEEEMTHEGHRRLFVK